MAAESDPGTLRSEFHRLHQSGLFIMPNVWDVGSAMVLQSLGFPALATTSSGFAAALGRHDQNVTLAELVVHVADLCAVLEVPLSVDAEFGYAHEADELGRAATRLAAAGAAGVSIEDYIPGRGILDKGEAAERVAVFSAAAHEEGMVVTARAENHLYETGDLDDTIGRLVAYHEAGADVVYAPGLSSGEDISRLVSEVGAPVNVVLLDGMTIAGLGDLGVRRVSTGGSLAFAAYGAAAGAGLELLAEGTTGYMGGALDPERRRAAFGEE